MARTIRTKVYPLNELTPAAQKVAINWYRNLQNEDNILDLFGFEGWCENKAKEKGFTDIKVSYSLSYSQGDGLSFIGTIDVLRMLKEANPKVSEKRLALIVPHINVVFNRNNRHYCFASKNDIDMYLDTPNNWHTYNSVDEIISNTLRYVEDVYIALCKELERDGYNWIEEADKDENIIENIVANGYEFYNTGIYFSTIRNKPKINLIGVDK